MNQALQLQPVSGVDPFIVDTEQEWNILMPKGALSLTYSVLGATMLVALTAF